MGLTKPSKIILLKCAILGTMLFSSLAVVYHVRWLIAFLLSSAQNHVPSGQQPLIWFCVQILSNATFLAVGYFMLSLFDRYKQRNYFDDYSLKVLNGVIHSCFFLAILGVIKLASSEFYPLPLDEYKSIWGTLNLMTFLLIDVVTFKEPQTMYLLIAIILWAVKQFSIKAIAIKSENEAII
ncbi:DUF2975 domain-containing protein [Algoriphagus sp. A40]|uniref:DUF2975 domain-containing protein n=1 Tax=Algoriphagus sp. A40 TaxID=1945863 RepID=UPI000985445B|nr:DUF2975 domain-containing protein [Algoriphagus sp. A40]OOG77502.1 hypothetical protein B0E43_05230 [Algoriphagus sp. A40]